MLILFYVQASAYLVLVHGFNREKSYKSNLPKQHKASMDARFPDFFFLLVISHPILLFILNIRSDHLHQRIGHPKCRCFYLITQHQSEEARIRVLLPLHWTSSNKLKQHLDQTIRSFLDLGKITFSIWFYLVDNCQTTPATHRWARFSETQNPN